MPKKPKRANLRGPGRCIFCGESGITHEHIWADWLREFIPREMRYHQTRSADVYLDRPDDVSIQRRTGDPHARRVYCVCKTCNSGWMSQLQEQVRPFLVPILTSEKITLHRRAQKTLASWAAMMTMAAEYMDPSKVAIPQTDRTHLLREGEPSDHCRIWIAAHRREHYYLFSHHVVEFSPEEEIKRTPNALSKEPNAQTTTACIGEHLLVHVLSSYVNRAIVRQWKLPPQVSPVIHQIWPIRTSTVSWPPASALNDLGIRLLADQFFEASVAFARDYYLR
jgi:hypothetical protein